MGRQVSVLQILSYRTSSVIFTCWKEHSYFEKLTGSQLVKKFHAFFETDGTLPHLQVPATCPYPEPVQSSPCPHITLPQYPS